MLRKKLINNKSVNPIPSIASSKKNISGLPVRLKIPKINVDAPIISVGITSQGEMGVPKGPSDTAWFDLGPRPGDMAAQLSPDILVHGKAG